VVVITKKNRRNCLPSVSGVLLRGVQRGTCVARWVCRQVRMWSDTARFLVELFFHSPSLRVIIIVGLGQIATEICIF